MSQQADPRLLDAKFHALADGTRRALVARLCLGPSSVKELAEPMPVSLPTVLKHLAILENGGLVHSEKAGRVRTFRLAPDAFVEVERWVGERKRRPDSRAANALISD
ncbi:MAG TPA: metalloregulator ArsR/SmtB family transcription factor [Burkholderiaceae bacterium]